MKRSQASISSVSSLPQLYRQNALARALLNVLLRHDAQSSRPPTDLALLRASLRHEQQVDADPRHLVPVLKQLSAAGCGKFWAGRRGLPSRFEWSSQAASLAQSATGGAAPELNKPESIAFVTHSYHLRPQLALSFSLPADLTEREANRLADYIRTLAF
jgi:hypothetical protein